MMRFLGAIGAVYLGRKAARQGDGHFEWLVIGGRYRKVVCRTRRYSFCRLERRTFTTGGKTEYGIQFLFQNWHTAWHAFVSQRGIISPASRQSIFLQGIGRQSRIDAQTKPGQHPEGNQAMDAPSIWFSESSLAWQRCMQPPGFISTLPMTAAVKNSDCSPHGSSRGCGRRRGYIRIQRVTSSRVPDIPGIHPRYKIRFMPPVLGWRS
jgi:hypothetical protein